MPISHAAASRQDLLPSFDMPLRQDGRPTITAQFLAFDAEYPYVYRALERLTAERLASGATRVGLKRLFEALRWQMPKGVRGLNNNYTALYARKLVAQHPHWVSVFELRRRRTP